MGAVAEIRVVKINLSTFLSQMETLKGLLTDERIV